MRKHERKNKVYVGFIDLEKTYERINRKTLWKVLRVYGVGGKLFSGINSMYAENADSLACVRVEGGEIERFRIDSGMGEGVSCLVCFSKYIWTQ